MLEQSLSNQSLAESLSIYSKLAHLTELVHDTSTEHLRTYSGRLTLHWYEELKAVLSSYVSRFFRLRRDPFCFVDVWRACWKSSNSRTWTKSLLVNWSNCSMIIVLNWKKNWLSSCDFVFLPVWFTRMLNHSYILSVGNLSHCSFGSYWKV